MTVSRTTTKKNPVSISGQQTTPWPRIWAARGPIGSNIAFFNAESAARWIADRTQPELYLTTEYVPDSLTAELQKENARLNALLNTPETEDFDKAIPLEAVHQVQRWGSAHDAGKNPEDWFWLVGYLAGKALSAQKAGDLTKAKHHTISAAAALRNWHAHIRSGESVMRPGIAEPAAVLSKEKAKSPNY